ncbi:glycosyltransferase [Herbaspirillum seropedicae]|uniref:glycosyltransferase n=1 Tax=Herbaspirillum seropedicae TaxID=964 RepID=UPI0011239C99|nr:glycosyltransferase [Herbaspirillum seropedicae]QDD66451.1 glycosyltransferase [Herbaspirillum seropedicae]
MKLIVHATNIHVGGGRSLLLALLNALPADVPVLATLDIRLELPTELPANLQVIRVAPTISARFAAERQLARLAQADDVVLCFGNLPPLFKLAGYVVTFVQNRYLIDAVSLRRFSWKTRLRLQCERLWLACKAHNVAEFVVQTPSMQRVFDASGKARGRPIHVLPFSNINQGYRRQFSVPAPKRPLPAFVYVASGEPHKNHRNLIAAWRLLAEEGIFPALKLTLAPNANHELCLWLQQQIQACQLRIENLGMLSHAEVQDLYASAQALIFPSVFESFGLPLIEARQAGLAVLASELDYVRDVVDPEEAFDPSSPISIAQAVKRFAGLDNAPLPLLDAHTFLATILKLNK